MNGKGSKRRPEDGTKIDANCDDINWKSKQEMPAKPQRIQRRRARGYDMQAESKALNGLPAVSVCRPGPWGNPFTLKPRFGPEITPAESVNMFRHRLEIAMDVKNKPISKDRWPGYDFIRMAIRLEELRGKNLACFCPLGQPCHADVLLDLANR